jgi:hypothetical protein
MVKQLLQTRTGSVTWMRKMAIFLLEQAPQKIPP